MLDGELSQAVEVIAEQIVIRVSERQVTVRKQAHRDAGRIRRQLAVVTVRVHREPKRAFVLGRDVETTIAELDEIPKPAPIVGRKSAHEVVHGPFEYQEAVPEMAESVISRSESSTRRAVTGVPVVAAEDKMLS